MEPVNGFIERHPSLKILALAFLILIGVVLVADGLGEHLSKGYVYFAMAFSLGVELLNMRYRRASHPPPVGRAPLRAGATGAIGAGGAAVADRGVRHGAAGRRSRAALPADGHPGQGRERVPPAPGLQRPAARAVRPLHGGARSAATSASRSATGATPSGSCSSGCPPRCCWPARRWRSPWSSRCRSASSPPCAATPWWITSGRWPPCSARPRPASGSG